MMDSRDLLAIAEEIGEFEDGLVPVEAGINIKSPFTIALIVALGVGIIAAAWFGYNKFLRKKGG